MSDMARPLLRGVRQMLPRFRSQASLTSVTAVAALLASLPLGACVIPANIEPEMTTTNRPPEIVSGDPDFMTLPYVVSIDGLMNGFVLTVTARDYDVKDTLRAHLYRLIGGDQNDEFAEITLNPTSVDGVERRNSFTVHKWCTTWGPNNWFVNVVVSDREFPKIGLPAKDNSASRTWVITCQ